MEIRLATEHDADAVLEIYAPIVRDTAISFEEEPPSREEIAQRIRTTLATHPWLVFEDAEVLGYAYATSYRSRGAYRWSVETTVYIHAGGRRRGIGSGLYASLFAILDLQGFMTAYAGITQPNEASVRLHESVGFEPVGIYRNVGFKLGEWRAVGWWQRQIGDPARPRPHPLPLDQVQHLDAWPRALTAGLPHIRPTPRS